MTARTSFSSVVLGTRDSALAREQARIAAEYLRRHHVGLKVDVRVFRTTGDVRITEPIDSLADDAFVDALERALETGAIDVAVHSAKDVPLSVRIDAYPERDDPRDVLVSSHGTLADLPSGAVVGTSSTSRTLQLLAVRPDLEARGIRGDVPSRIRQLARGHYDAIILAAAGLHRLGLERHIGEYLPTETFLPSPGQGALALTTRGNDDATRVVRSVSDAATEIAVSAERAFSVRVAQLGQLTSAAYATIAGSRLRIEGMVAATPDRIVRRVVVGDLAEGHVLAKALADSLARDEVRAA
jgi:hydroxymethylbilane synthase